MLDAADRRQSNDGHRKLDLPERVLVFLTRVRRKTPFRELAYQYGCGKSTAKRYYDEIVNVFHEHLVPRLVFPRAPDELVKMARAEVKQVYPDLLAILDATNWEQLKPENFLENRLSYSAYKHRNVYQALFGKCIHGVYAFCTDICCVSVVSTERLVLWRSEIFGGISNEISVILDQSTLLRDMKGLAFGLGSVLC